MIDQPRIAPGTLHARPGHDPSRHRARAGLPDALRRRKIREGRDRRKLRALVNALTGGDRKWPKIDRLTKTDNFFLAERAPDSP